ncbi:MAG: hypothetical protein JG777_3185 [Clostridia bacterium]|jgi:hypothetical protein|nr:hypothetical protein [Clostridia bacterium]
MDEKKGFFSRLIGNRKAKKSSCCCNIELEEIPEEKEENKEERSAKDTSKPCC